MNEDAFLGIFCTCSNPTWVAGGMYVDVLDAESVDKERQGKGLSPMRDERCDKQYHPYVSFDPYAG